MSAGKSHKSCWRRTRIELVVDVCKRMQSMLHLAGTCNVLLAGWRSLCEALCLPRTSRGWVSQHPSLGRWWQERHCGIQAKRYFTMERLCSCLPSLWPNGVVVDDAGVVLPSLCKPRCVWRVSAEICACCHTCFSDDAGIAFGYANYVCIECH